MPGYADDDGPLLRNMLIALGLLIVVTLGMTFTSTKRRGKGA
jgi:hypothetical protein